MWGGAGRDGMGLGSDGLRLDVHQLRRLHERPAVAPLRVRVRVKVRVRVGVRVKVRVRVRVRVRVTVTVTVRVRVTVRARARARVRARVRGAPRCRARWWCGGSPWAPAECQG